MLYASNPFAEELPVTQSTLERPHHFVDAAARLDVLNRVYGSDAAVAKLLDVDRSQPRRWREGQLPDPANASRLTILATVVEVLSALLSPTSIPKWLAGPNAHLGDRTPIQLLKKGNVAEVFEAMDALRTGTYA
jgi:uncharacterized protein (DUF2384 family)